MKKIIASLVAILLTTVVGCSRDSLDSADNHKDTGDKGTRAERLAHSLIIADTHVDVPYRLREEYQDVSTATSKGDFDYPRAIAGGLDAPFMSIYVPARYEGAGEAKKLADELIDSVEAIVQAAPDKFALAHSSGDIKVNFAAGKISLPMGMENGSPIEGELANLKHFHERGIRYITLAHSKSNHIADSSFDAERQWNGLSDFGREVVQEMNRIGIIIDVSHISDAAFFDVIDITEAPVIASHSSVRHYTPNFERNMNDDMIKALAENGGAICINFGSAFLIAEATEWLEEFRARFQQYVEENGLVEDGEKAKAFRKAYRETHPITFAILADVLNHIDHVTKLVGVDHVCLGSDFDGVGDSLPVDLKDVSHYPNLIDGLLKRGYSVEDVEKILSGNVLRIWARVEEIAGT